MSQYSDHCSTLNGMLAKFPEHPAVVLETFYNTVTNQEWDKDDVVGFFEHALGGRVETDALLKSYMARAEREL